MGRPHPSPFQDGQGRHPGQEAGPVVLQGRGCTSPGKGRGRCGSSWSLPHRWWLFQGQASFQLSTPFLLARIHNSSTPFIPWLPAARLCGGPFSLQPPRGTSGLEAQAASGLSGPQGTRWLGEERRLLVEGVRGEERFRHPKRVFPTSPLPLPLPKAGPLMGLHRLFLTRHGLAQSQRREPAAPSERPSGLWATLQLPLTTLQGEPPGPYGAGGGKHLGGRGLKGGPVPAGVSSAEVQLGSWASSFKHLRRICLFSLRTFLKLLMHLFK